MVNPSGNRQGSGEAETQESGHGLSSSLLRRLARNSAGLALQGVWFRLGVGTGCQPLPWVVRGWGRGMHCLGGWVWFLLGRMDEPSFSFRAHPVIWRETRPLGFPW